MSRLDDLVARIEALPPRARVGIDGVDCSGKTTLGDLLARRLRRPCVRASVDDFPHPAEVRHRRGRDSPEGCYLDTTDHRAVWAELLTPFAEGRPHRTRTWSLAADAPDPGPLVTAPEDAVLVVDGVFVQRPELADAWDLVVLLQLPEAEVLRRAAARDGEEAVPRYRRRYLPAQALYVAEVDPAARADVVLDGDWLDDTG